MGGAIAAVAVAVRRRPADIPTPVEPDEVVVVKSRVQQLLALEEDLIAAGQALGRVRRFLLDPEEATPVVDELRERLADLWLRRFDFEGCLRLATLRRRMPDPPAMLRFQDDQSAAEHQMRSIELRALSDAFREVARRADDSARMFRRLLPAEDAHARWVGDAVDVAREWRMAQTEEILRFSGRINALADRVEELAVHMAELVAAERAEAGPDADDDLLPVTVPGLQERMLELTRVGLEEKRTRELVPGSAAELDTERAMISARETIAEVRALARKAGATRSTRTPVTEAAPAEAVEVNPG